MIGLSRSQNIHVDWSGGTPHLPHLEEGQRFVAEGGEGSEEVVEDVKPIEEEEAPATEAKTEETTEEPKADESAEEKKEE